MAELEGVLGGLFQQLSNEEIISLTSLIDTI